MVKRTLLLLLLLASPVLADGMLIFVLRTTASVEDRQTIKAKFFTRFNDRTAVSLTDLRKVRLISNTNVVAWVLPVALDQVRWFQPDLPTREEFETWKENALAKPSLLQVYHCSDFDWVGRLSIDGIELVPVPYTP